jgi:CRISPR-associated protein Cas5d
MQLFATVLADVCYRLHGWVQSGDRREEGNTQHYLQDLFMRRLAQGRCYRTPSLGWRELTCSYWGIFREDMFEVDRDLNLTIPSMLRDVWSSAHGGHYAPRFDQNVKVQAGVLNFAK